ncbi:hypothetical protein [Candidatus Berkiella aquae]|uniref:DNA replication terminus site-binding protein n=1 Tax=Candidatus Berkiella aquae TaxID=295108 RepID=A0A0Q9YPM9_9GAMM|nr:hypothetical protein [Candidatus Berkiella aquae]MCS5711865.1 hypothetical protein [Candidatus Berkiella aquae]
MQEAILRQDVLDTFLNLQMNLDKLCDAIRLDSNLIAWVHEEAESQFYLGDLSARDKAIALFKQIQYLDCQAPREIIVLPGFIGASNETLIIVNEVNLAKEQFKKSILALKAAKINPQANGFSEQMDALLNKHPLPFSVAMHKMGLARLHLKQCYRKIPILKAPPQKISWTWAHTKAIKRISLAKAQEMLLKKGEDSGIQLQLQKLHALPQNEQLAIVQELAPHLRSNIVLQGETATRMMIKGPVPIFFPCEAQTPYPVFKIPLKKSLRDQNRSVRNDVRLDPVPFLPAIRAYRYAK